MTDAGEQTRAVPVVGEAPGLARILVPLAGEAGEGALLREATSLAAAFDAELAAVHVPLDAVEMTPWVSEGLLGGVQVAALESLKAAAAESSAAARDACGSLGYARCRFSALDSPAWAALAMEARLSDLAVFDAVAARGRGRLAEPFRQLLADEQRPVLVFKQSVQPEGVAAIAWDGGKEAARAVRTALPLLRRASRVVIMTAVHAADREVEPERLRAFLAARGVAAEVELMPETGEAAPLLLYGARRCGASLLVAGAFGHTRLREFVFGSATRSLLQGEGPSLFLSH